ncbi:MAG: hypothetical protein IKD66_01735 [Solobacterium sp.]|nr:hypothetical protein [Solobacterium sp.]
MNHTVINNELAMDWPDSFHEMSAQELKESSISAPSEGFSIRDNEKRILISVHWKKLPFLLSAFADPKQNMKSTEEMIRNGLKDHEYQMIGWNETETAGQKAPGFAYEYTIRGNRQYSEALFLKHGSYIYAVYFYGLSERKDEGRAVFEEVLASLKFVS